MACMPPSRSCAIAIINSARDSFIVTKVKWRPLAEVERASRRVDWTLTGRSAWLAWLFVHVWNLVGFRNRAAVVFQWAWNYLFSRRESRLITGRLIVSEES